MSTGARFGRGAREAMLGDGGRDGEDEGWGDGRGGGGGKGKPYYVIAHLGCGSDRPPKPGSRGGRRSAGRRRLA